MSQKSKVTGLFYTVESLSEKDKLRLFPDEIIKELKKVPESVKKNPVVSKKENVNTGKVIIGSPSLKENKKKKK